MHSLDAAEADGGDGTSPGMDLQVGRPDGPGHDRVQHAEGPEVVQGTGVHHDGA
jgi:hypothetical protein